MSAPGTDDARRTDGAPGTEDAPWTNGAPRGEAAPDNEGAPQTEYSFTLPVGLVDSSGVRHRKGSMRLATARDEIEPLRDERVRENSAYASVLRLARVLTNLGAVQPVTPAHVEQLYAADFGHLKRLYEQINSTSVSASASALPGSAPLRPPALARVSDAALGWMFDGAEPTALDSPADLPIGIVHDRERRINRETLERSDTQPRRGRVHEGAPPHVDALPQREFSGEPLMRLSSQPPATPASAPAAATQFTATRPDVVDTTAHDPANGGVDMEDVYEQMIVRLRRELLSERERMGTPLGT